MYVCKLLNSLSDLSLFLVSGLAVSVRAEHAAGTQETIAELIRVNS